MATESRNHKTAEALLDATERLLISHGHAGVTTRRVAEEAGLPHGLIRYHFGSLEELLLQTVRRAAGRILERQRDLYGGEQPFTEMWRAAMNFIDVDLAAGFPKLTGELFAKAWNDPVYRDGLRETLEQFTGVLAHAVTVAAGEYGVKLDSDNTVAIATLIRTFQLGMLVERLADIDIGHAELLTAIDGWLSKNLEGDRDAGAPA